jgi:hypothetical protein
MRRLAAQPAALLWFMICLILASCAEQTRQYKRSYLEFEQGHYRDVSVMGGLPWCDEPCKLRATAASGIVLVESHADVQKAFADLRTAVNDPLFTRDIPPNQQQRVLDDYCLAAYRAFRLSSAANSSLVPPISLEQIQRICSKASEGVRAEINSQLTAEYGQMITGLIQTGHLKEAKNATMAYTMLPTADRSQSAQWEQQIARSTPAGASAPSQSAWLLVRDSAEHSAGSPRAGEPTPIIVGIYRRSADCRRVRHQLNGQTPHGALSPDADEANEGGLACLSSADPVWRGKNPLNMWLLLMGEQWNKSALTITCKPRAELAHAASLGIYPDAQSCDQARKELFGDIPCALCLPANDSDVAQ